MQIRISKKGFEAFESKFEAFKRDSKSFEYKFKPFERDLKHLNLNSNDLKGIRSTQMRILTIRKGFKTISNANSNY